MEKKGINLHEFSKLSGLAISVVHALYHGNRKPQKRTARKVEKATKGELTLEDFGLK